LSLIRGYAETNKDVSGDNPKKREKQLEVIIEETERLTRIVDDILNLSQLQTGYIKLDKTQLSIKKLLKNVTEHFDVLSEESGIKIIWDSSGEIYIEADRGRIEQVLYNLINNAINHTPSGGVVHVRAIDQVDKVRIEVKDNGYGIPEEDIPHIWERFYKSDKTGSRKSMGTGLGLAIVKQVLEAHETKFGVESKINKGSTFWFEIKKSSCNC
jgi:signal transduction histidine kinase